MGDFVERVDWIEWNKDLPCPVGLDDMVDVRYKNHDIRHGQAKRFEWRTLKTSNPITHYRVVTKAPTDTALTTQVGGDHYKKLKIQPMEYSMANNLNACQHTIIKYVTRYKDKNGIEDLKKARHTIDMLIEMESNETKTL